MLSGRGICDFNGRWRSAHRRRSLDHEHCWLSRRSRQENRWIVQALGVQALAIQADSAMIDGRFSA
ncbi:hypothetical protein [Nostoc sp.]|uniref:hypothetical protein n=1 Tax=Nostoc sp. TaxID=1180 RepID=UPI002FF84175